MAPDAEAELRCRRPARTPRGHRSNNNSDNAQSAQSRARCESVNSGDRSDPATRPILHCTGQSIGASPRRPLSSPQPRRRRAARPVRGLQDQSMRLSQKSRTLAIAGSRLRARRTSEGVIEIWGNDAIELQRGLGYFHAHDRLVQMILVRLVGQGRLCECLKDDDESLAIDIFMRQMGFAKTAREEVGRLTPHALAFAQAYAEGVNESLRRHWRPFEFALVGYRPEPWEPADTLLTINLMSYVGLAQTQQDIEKFLIQAIQQGANVERLKKLFAPHLDGLTDELVDLISRVRIVDAIVPPLTAAVPSFQCSNNWAVGPARSASGNALECHDPHLECNRLPAVWYEVLLHMPGNYHVGASMPGVPGVVMGRSRDVSAGFTYGFMDMVDYF